jgi:hypothetical protein
VATTTPRQGLPVPTDADSPLGGTQFQTFGTAVEKYVNQRYASASARGTAIPTPVEGEEYYQNDTNVKYVHNGSAWVPYVQGAKLLATDTGAGSANWFAGGAGPYTIHSSRTVSDPFGTGVPFMLFIYAQMLVDGVATSGAFEIVSPALSATIVKSARIAGGGTYNNLAILTFPTGGSQSFSTRLNSLTAGVTTYADVTNNFIYYVALPLWT